MKVPVTFYSYFKELTGCGSTEVEAAEGTSLGELVGLLEAQFPRLVAMRKSTLIAVGVEYQDRNYRLQAGDEVALFPPVQGG